MKLPLLCISLLCCLTLASQVQAQQTDAAPLAPAEPPSPPQATDASEDFAPAEAPSPEEVAASLHAKALLAEHDGNLPEALKLLREAHEQDPNDEDIAFDLARVSFEEAPSDPEGRTTVEQRDVSGFLAMDLVSPDARVLRAYILEASGDRQRARAELETAMRAAPEQDEALALKAAMADEPQDSAMPSWLGVRAWSAAQYDTNIAVVSDDNPSHIAGPRMQFGGELFITAYESQKARLDFLVNGQLGIHMSGKQPDIPDSLARYDFGSVFVLANLTALLDPVELRAQLFGSQVFIDIFRPADTHHFLQEGGGRLTLLMANLGIKPGLYVEGGYRDFVAGNPLDDPLLNRDTPRVASGVQVETRQGRLSLFGFAGYQQEFAVGSDFQLRGLDSGVFARYRVLDRTVLGVDVRYQWRDHFMHSTGRSDHRIEPRARIAHQFQDWLAVSASYFYTRNLSQDVFDFTRHMAQLGLEGAW